MRFFDLLASLFVGCGWVFQQILGPPAYSFQAVAAGPPDPRRKQKPPLYRRKLSLECLEGREVPAASVLSLAGLTAVTAIDVLDSGIVEAVGYTTDPTTGLNVGEFVTVSTSGQVATQQLGSGSLLGASVTPLALSNGRAVGMESGFSPSTGQVSVRALGWDLSQLGTVYDLGSVGTHDFTEAASLNASGLWGGFSDGVRLAVYGQLFGQTTPTVLSTPAGTLLASVDAVAADGTKLVTLTFVGLNATYVFRPDNTFVQLVNPFASEGSTTMFAAHISNDGTKVLANAERFNPVSETWDKVPVVFSGPNWSEWTAATLPDGSSFFGLGADIENSGTVTIAATDGVYLWASAQPSALPQKVDSTMLGAADAQNIPFGIAFRSGNPTVEKGGATFVAATGPNGAYLIQIGTYTATPPNDPPATITAATNGVTVVDLSKYHTATTITVNAPVKPGQVSVVNFVGTADHPMQIVYSGGAGANIVNFSANGPLSVTADLGAGNDIWNGAGSDAVFVVHGGAGSDILIGGRNADKLYGDAGSDVILGMEGDDEIWTGSGFNFADGGPGADQVHSGSFFDIVVLLDRDDELWGRAFFVVGRPRRHF